LERAKGLNTKRKDVVGGFLKSHGGKSYSEAGARGKKVENDVRGIFFT